MKECHIDGNEIKIATKSKAKMIVKKQVKAKILEQLKSEGEHKSKVSHLLRHGPKKNFR